jgi:hypothetical protein
MRTLNPPRLLLLLGLVLSLAVGAAACGPAAPDPDIPTETPIPASSGNTNEAGDEGEAGEAGDAGEAATDEPAASPPPAANPADTGLPEDIPVLANAEKLSATGDGTYISYEAESSVADALAFYQEQMLAAGWEMMSKQDPPLSDNITLLRQKADKRISITIQAAFGQDNVVRVRMTVIPN